MKKVFFMLTIMLASVLSSCTKNESIMNENGKVELSFCPKLEMESSLLSRTIDNSLYAIYIEKVEEDEPIFYAQGVFTDPSLMLLKADKGLYNIYCTIINEKYFNNTRYNNEPFKYDKEIVNTFVFEKIYHLYNDIINSSVMTNNWDMRSIPSTERYYTEIKNLQVSSDKNIELNMKYMVFGVKLNGTNLGKGRTLKMHIENSETDLNVTNKDSINTCLYVVPNNLSEWFNDKDKTDSISCTFSLNGSILLKKKIEIRRKELYTFNINCSSFNFNKEDSTLIKENIFNY